MSVIKALSFNSKYFIAILGQKHPLNKALVTMRI